MFVVIPMAGRGTRTEQYGIPKPLIPLNGEPMVKAAIQSLGMPKAHYIFITRKYSNPTWNEKLNKALTEAVPDPIIFEIDYVTEGPACTALLAQDWIIPSMPLIVTNCDQVMKWDAQKFVDHIENTTDDGVVVTYDAQTLKNSSVRLDDGGYALEIREKEILGPESLNGIHFWKRGIDFIVSAERMIKLDERVNGEFYIAPTYNHLIRAGMKISTYHIPADQHWATGTPEDIQKYLESLDADV